MGAPVQRFSAEDRRQQILDVARRLFATKGFEGTTTREIAQEARINEAIIFRHFPTKEDLYWAVLEETSDITAGRGLLEADLKETGDVRRVFTAIAERMIRRRETDMTFTRLLLFSALEKHKLSERFFQAHVAQYYEMLAEYIRAQVAAGVFRPVDPMIAARGFFGMVIYHSLIQHLFGGQHVQPLDARTVAETLTSIWLDGMLPAESPKRSGDRQASRQRPYSIPITGSRTAKRPKSKNVPESI